MQPQPRLKLSSPATSEFWEIPILYEDPWLLAVAKPSGLLVSPDRYDPERANLMKLLHRDIARGASWARERSITYLSNVHRLDFDTTGVLLLARDKASLVHLANQFGCEKPHKEYLALVQGNPAEDAFRVNAKIGPFPGRPGHMRVDPKHGKRSATSFEVLERFAGCAWLLCRPETGRTHQIRVHLTHARHVLVGDRIYGGRPLLLSRLKKDYRLKPGRVERPLLERHALHAHRLTVEHPSQGHSVTIEAPLPKDLSVALKYLRKFAFNPSSNTSGLDPEPSMMGEEFDQPDGDQDRTEQ